MGIPTALSKITTFNLPGKKKGKNIIIMLLNTFAINLKNSGQLSNQIYSLRLLKGGVKSE